MRRKFDEPRGTILAGHCSSDTIRDKWPPTAPQTLISLRLQQEMEETADVPARVGVYQPLDDVEVGLLRLHRRPAAHWAGSLSTVLRKQQVSPEFEIAPNM